MAAPKSARFVNIDRVMDKLSSAGATKDPDFRLWVGLAELYCYMLKMRCESLPDDVGQEERKALGAACKKLHDRVSACDALADEGLLFQTRALDKLRQTNITWDIHSAESAFCEAGSAAALTDSGPLALVGTPLENYVQHVFDLWEVSEKIRSECSDLGKMLFDMWFWAKAETKCIEEAGETEPSQLALERLGLGFVLLERCGAKSFASLKAASSNASREENRVYAAQLDSEYRHQLEVLGVSVKRLAANLGVSIISPASLALGFDFCAFIKASPVLAAVVAKFDIAPFEMGGSRWHPELKDDGHTNG